MGTDQISFEYNNFKKKTVKDSDNACPDPVKKICLYGDAKYAHGGLDVDYSFDGWGAAVYSEQIRFRNKQTNQTASFTSEFTFTIEYTGYQNASGILAFFMSDFPFHPSSGYLGLERRSSSFIAVDLDKETDVLDVDEIQLGLHLNSEERVKHEITPFQYNSDIDGVIGRVVVDYDSVNLNLSVSLHDEYSSQHAKFSHGIDLSTILQENVVIGFVSTSNISTDEHIIDTWNFSSTFPVVEEDPVDPSTKRSKTKWLAGSLVIGMVALICLLGLAWFFWMGKAKKQKDEVDVVLDDEFQDEQGVPKKFSYKQLVNATDNFNPKRKLGEGGFGPVYSGSLQDQNLNVAVKKLSGKTHQGRKEYIAEVKIISNLRHKNLVRLIGWCHEKCDLLLVYEFMENGSLDSFILDSKKPPLIWSLRYKIVKGLVSALNYLHEQSVVHRDVKPSNVMLDKSFDAKLGDFGLARFSDREGGAQTKVMAGTRGYIAPECFVTGKTSKESDVYAFGILALEMACSRKNIYKNSTMTLVEWVWKMYGSGRLMDVVDEKIVKDDDFNKSQVVQMLILGLWCAHPDPKQRPTMIQAISALNFQSSLPNLPKEMPVFVGDHPKFHITGSTSQTNSSFTNSAPLPPSSR